MAVQILKWNMCIIYIFQNTFAIRQSSAPLRTFNLSIDTHPPPLQITEDILLFSGNTIKSFHIQNWKDAIAPFENYGCLVHTTSFEGTATNFNPGPRYPIILRKLSPARITITSQDVFYNGSWIRISLLPSGVPLPENILFGESYEKCPQSSITYSSELIMSTGLKICSQIDLLKFSVRSKPWRCEIHIGLFPPIYLNIAEIVFS